TASLATMMTYLARLNLETVEPGFVGGYWADRLETMLQACVRDRELLGPDRSIDVRFNEFMADDVGMVERIYVIAGQPFTGVRAVTAPVMRTTSSSTAWTAMARSSTSAAPPGSRSSSRSIAFSKSASSMRTPSIRSTWGIRLSANSVRRSRSEKVPMSDAVIW